MMVCWLLENVDLECSGAVPLEQPARTKKKVHPIRVVRTKARITNEFLWSNSRQSCDSHHTVSANDKVCCVGKRKFVETLKVLCLFKERVQD